MMEDNMNLRSLFEESLKNHQKLVDVLVDAQDENGISRLSQSEMARRVDHSQTWVSQAIRRINAEDVCIEKISAGVYRVHYSNLAAQGVFSKILNLMIDCYCDFSVFQKKDREIAEEWDLKLRTVQMFRAYLLTYWKREQDS